MVIIFRRFSVSSGLVFIPVLVVQSAFTPGVRYREIHQEGGSRFLQGPNRRKISLVRRMDIYGDILY